MALVYQTKVNNVRVKKDLDGIKNVITRVFYTSTVTAEDGCTMRFPFELRFEDAVDPATFVDISQVDEPTLIGWIENHPNYFPMPESTAEALIQREREKEYIENYPFPFLEPIQY